jgi:hypothetical protein
VKHHRLGIHCQHSKFLSFSEKTVKCGRKRIRSEKTLASGLILRRGFCLWNFRLGVCIVLIAFIVLSLDRSIAIAAETSSGEKEAPAGLGAGAAIAAAAAAAGLSPAAVVGLALGAAAAVVGMTKVGSEDKDGANLNSDPDIASPPQDID